MRIWFDTEFIDDGRYIDLISIGMIREDGKTLYLESSDFDMAKIIIEEYGDTLESLSDN